MLICIPTEGQMRRLSLILSMCDKYEASRSGYLLPPGISRRLDAFPGNCLAIPHKSANCFMLGLLRETFSLFRSHGNSLLTVSILCAKLTLHAARGNLILTWAGSNICKANSFSKMFNISFQYILKTARIFGAKYQTDSLTGKIRTTCEYILLCCSWSWRCRHITILCDITRTSPAGSDHGSELRCSRYFSHRLNNCSCLFY